MSCELVTQQLAAPSAVSTEQKSYSPEFPGDLALVQGLAQKTPLTYELVTYTKSFITES